jgi:hypothetical protein
MDGYISLLIADKRSRKLRTFGKTELNGTVRPPFPKYWDREKKLLGWVAIVLARLREAG